MQKPQLLHPEFSIAGGPSIKQYHVLNDKRHILVRESWNFLFWKNLNFFFQFHIYYLDCFFIYYFYVQGVWKFLQNASYSVYQFETQ